MRPGPHRWQVPTHVANGHVQMCLFLRGVSAIPFVLALLRIPRGHSPCRDRRGCHFCWLRCLLFRGILTTLLYRPPAVHARCLRRFHRRVRRFLGLALTTYSALDVVPDSIPHCSGPRIGRT